MVHIRQDSLVRHLIPLGFLGIAALALGRLEIEGEAIQLGWLFVALLMAGSALGFFFPMLIGFVPLTRISLPGRLRKWFVYLSPLLLLIWTLGRFLFLGCGESMCLLFLLKRLVPFRSVIAEQAFVYTGLILAALTHLVVARDSIMSNAEKLREDLKQQEPNNA